MAIRLTESQLRQIIREEASRLTRRPLRESYSNKLSLIRDAIDLLREAQVMEQRSAMGKDPDLDQLIKDLEGYAEAVETMADAETNEYHSTAPVADWLKRPPSTPQASKRTKAALTASGWRLPEEM